MPKSVKIIAVLRHAKRLLVPALLPTLLLIGCASSRPKFQKVESGKVGYWITNGIGPKAFSLRVNLGTYRDPKYTTLYAYRAIGEECLSRGFKFYDFASIDSENFEGYCYESADHPALAVDFRAAPLVTNPPRLVVSETHDKSPTELQKGDELLTVDGKPVLSVALLKSHIYRATLMNQRFVELKIKRGGDEKQIKEPIAWFKNSSLGSTQLDLVRARID